MYQLVLQFVVGSAEDFFDRAVAFEDRLIEVLGDGADVDGHDLGQGEMNIFIFTPSPKSTFEVCLRQLDGSDLRLAGAAYRAADEEQYWRIWPGGSLAPFVVA